MTLQKISAYVVYICVTIFGNAGFAESITTPKIPLSLKGQVKTPIQLPSKEKLILINKDLKKSLEALRPEGPRTGGGGNSCAMAITRNTKKLVDFLTSDKNTLVEGDQLTRLLQSIESASFFTAEYLEINGQKKEAINYPHLNKIVLSESFCKYEMADVSSRAMSLLFHEYLGLARIDDRKYEISGQFLEISAQLNSARNATHLYLQAEAEKDLNGKSSCFKGALRSFAKQMENGYGGRYSSNFSLTASEAGSTYYRAPAKYCSQDEKTGQRVCNTTSTQEYLTTVTMSAATSGSLETEARIFVVTENHSTLLVVKEDADDFPEEQDIISRKEETQYRCQEIKVPSTR